MNIENHVNPDMDELMHFGVKGMKWGVRKKYDPHPRKSKPKKAESDPKNASRNEAIKEYMAVKPRKLSEKEQVAHLKENQAKFRAKFGDIPKDGNAATDAKTGFLDKQKEKWDSKTTGEKAAFVGKVALTAAAVGYVGYTSYSTYKQFNAKGGDAINPEIYKFKSLMSKSRTWNGSGYIKASSYNQKEFTLPAGHVFHRISTNAETTFKNATYATSNIDDYNRYLTAFRDEKGANDPLHHITWSTKEAIKVPDLLTRLETLREVLQETSDDPNVKITRERALSRYQSMSGKSWDDSVAKKFFSALEKKGYGAIIDDMDAGVIGEAPLVIFKNSAMTDKVTEVISDDMIKTAESSLKEIYNRK